jgi:single-strand DNA-binding protein
MTHQMLILIGRLGSDPEMRYTPNGQAVVNFSLASHHQYVNKDNTVVKETTWFKVSAWGKLAEACGNFLAKGSQVYVEGRLVVDSVTGGPHLWTRQDGSAAASFEVRANLIRFLGSKAFSPDISAEQAAPVPAEVEIPF